MVHATNEEVRAKIQQGIGPHENLLTIVYSNCSGMVMSPIHQVWPKPSCKVQRKGKKTRQTEKRLEDNIREWTGLEFAKSRKAV